jgi:hypothetical protein
MKIKLVMEQEFFIRMELMGETDLL